MTKNPNFFCIVAQKAGTTSHYNILIQNPKIYLPRKKKEVHFFDDDKNYSKGIDWYIQKYFRNIESEKVFGEITPAYLYFSNVSEIIYKTLGPNIKFIFILRDSIDRAISLYNMIVSRKEEDLSFYDAIEYESGRLNTISIETRKNYSYIDRGYYSKKLMNYYNFLIKKTYLF